MSVSNIIATNSQTATSAASAIPLPTQSLSEQDFLNLLVTQMTAQDPLDPMTNEDMLSQMVQFSTLNANTSLQSQLTKMQSGQQLSDANSLLGRQVTLQVNDTTTAQGVVSGVDLSSGTPQIVVNGQSDHLSQIVSVTNPAAAQ